MEYLASPGVTAFLRVASLPAASSNESVPKQVLIGVAIGIAAFAFISISFLVWISRKLKALPTENSDSEEESFLEALPGLPPRFSFKELHDATEGFREQLGSGASGAVYQGDLQIPSTDHSAESSNRQHAIKVAVKELKLSKNMKAAAAASKKLFRAEVATLGNLNHVNLVQLRGFCAEGLHRLLIYEFMENGSLDKWIFSTENSRILPWDARYRIAVDTARGLAFLHEECRDKVVHLDVKPQNILLDAGFRAKLADFGLSKLMDRENSQTMTAMRGTPGYMAPEWFLNLPITDRSDVFSYGMVLLELVGGRKNFDPTAATSEELYLPAWALKQAETGNLWEVVDKRLVAQLRNEADKVDGLAKMEVLINVAFWCIQEDVSCRPSMTTVLLILEGHLQVPDPPLHLVYVPRARQQFFSKSSSAPTVSNASTLLSPR